MTNEEILANAPEGATHVDENGFYWTLEFNRKVVFGTESERIVTNSYVYRSLSDIRRIVELEQCLVEVTNGATGQAPCAKYCEARATAIEMRKLRAENERLYNALANFEGVEQEISALKHESNRKSQRIENVQRRKAEYKKRAEAAESELENERMISMKRFVETGRAERFAIEQKINVLESLINATKPCGKFGAMHVSDSEINRRLKNLRQQLNGGD